MILLTMMACGGDTVTTETTLVGKIVDSSGAPVSGVLVQSIEDGHTTGSDGGFRLKVEPPNRFVHFTSKGTWYRRNGVASDEGKVFELTLPEVAELAVQCPDVACDLALVWELSEGFEAQFRPACEPGGTAEVPAAPTSAPTVRCTQGKNRDQRLLPMDVEYGDGKLSIRQGGAEVRIEVRAKEGPIPEDCAVRVGDRVAKPAGMGFWTAPVPSGATAAAVCQGVPAQPVWVLPEQASETVVLHWRPEGPSLDMSQVAPWAEEVVLTGGAAGWSLPMAPQNGRVQLPPLKPEVYQILVRGSGTELPLAVSAPTSSAAGTAVFAEAGAEQLVGRLEVKAPLGTGEVPAEMAP
ncbi:MAG: carboxypeptidase-like regulatory domain-containing protein [Myxococcales bacterium]|nr:carboxypeptidase-like regulatory domain-containing protein [Myxococcales bacterium]